MPVVKSHMEKIINCMLIDDDPEEHEWFGAVLSKTLLPVRCTFTKNSIETLTYLRYRETNLPNFIFLDWNLSGGESMDCLMALKVIVNWAMQR
jgi:CheY-like chemotaxis protein